MADDEQGAPNMIHARLEVTLNDVSVEATARTRRNFGSSHLKAANHFADELAVHEDTHRGEPFGNQFDKCRWLGSAAFIMSFAAVEAAVDEAQNDLGIVGHLSEALRSATVLNRAQIVLGLHGAAVFDIGQAPYQPADILRRIRNALVHPQVEWSDELDEHKRLSNRIVSLGIPLSPFLPQPNEAFPLGCNSAAMAKWAVHTASRFVVELRQRLGLDAKAFTL